MTLFLEQKTMALVIQRELRTVRCGISGGGDASGELAETEAVFSRGVRVTGICRRGRGINRANKVNRSRRWTGLWDMAL